jgi:hypothetical protein
MADALKQHTMPIQLRMEKVISGNSFSIWRCHSVLILCVWAVWLIFLAFQEARKNCGQSQETKKPCHIRDRSEDDGGGLRRILLRDLRIIGMIAPENPAMNMESTMEMPMIIVSPPEWLHMYTAVHVVAATATALASAT